MDYSFNVPAGFPVLRSLFTDSVSRMPSFTDGLVVKVLGNLGCTLRHLVVNKSHRNFLLTRYAQDYTVNLQTAHFSTLPFMYTLQMWGEKVF